MDFIFSRLQHRNADGSLQIMYTIHGELLYQLGIRNRDAN